MTVTRRDKITDSKCQESVHLTGITRIQLLLHNCIVLYIQESEGEVLQQQRKVPSIQSKPQLETIDNVRIERAGKSNNKNEKRT